MTKETLLLIPGTGCDARVWAHQMVHLSSMVQVVVADLTGADTMAKMVSQALRGLPETFLLAGHSLGGCVCFEILKRHPRRVKKLCLLAPDAAADEGERYQARQERIEIACHGDYEALVHKLVNGFTSKQSLKPALVNMMLENKQLFISQQRAILNRDSYFPLLKTITQPTAVLVGRQDAFFLKSSKAIAEQMPQAHFEILERCGHMLTMEQPQVTTVAMKRLISC